MMKGRGEAQDLLLHGVDQVPLLQGGLDAGLRLDGEFQGQEHSPAPDLDHALAGLGDLFEPFPKPGPDGGDLLQESFGEDRLEECQGGGAGHRVAAEGSGVAAGPEGLGRLAPGEHGPQGQTAPQGLGEGHDVGHHPRGLVGEEGSRAAESQSGPRPG